VIISEALMFGALIAMRGAPHAAPSGPTIALAATVAATLFAGAAALASALRRIRIGRVADAGRLLSIAGIAGGAGLVLELSAARLAALADPLAVAIVGLHAAHVAAAVALSAWSLALLRSGSLHRRRHDMLSLIASYWYFVACVGVFVWPLLTGPRA
jgi:heme/copper-type cytochrome/quinol oxidase subunit 3